MAKADSVLVNDNPIFKNTTLVDSFTECHIFENFLIKHRVELLKDLDTVEIDERYDYRPDRLAYEIYKQDFWFPAILIANNIGSILQFKAGSMNFKCKIPKKTNIDNIIKKIEGVRK